MKYTISDAHIKYFQENGLIEFENLLPKNLLEKALDLEKKEIFKHTSRRDLFRKFEIIKKIAFNKTVSSIFKTLTKKQHLRLAFDQLIIKNEKTPFNEPFSLNSISSFQGLIGGIIINLDHKTFDFNNLNKNTNSIFIKSSVLINIESIFSDSDVFLLIAYGEIKTVYKKSNIDINSNYLKDLGYNFGDTLKDYLHPIVF